MVLITIVTGAYKPTYNWGASYCMDIMGYEWNKLMGIKFHAPFIARI